ncbi:unnamed protein product, partial [Ilex paraguariensis]
MQLMGFPEGELPGRYLGVPLIITKLKAGDCQPLVEKITAKGNACDPSVCEVCVEGVML